MSAANEILDTLNTPDIKKVTEKYAVSLSPHLKTQLHDPAIAAQYLPAPEELITRPDETEDPIGDEAHSPVKGIVHRYPDRVLLKPVNVCAVYCRYCFRREKIGPGKSVLKPNELEAALNYIRNTPSIWEVILTGGDPLILSPKKLTALLDELEKIKHVQIVRIHTRIPIANPERITDEMLQTLTRHTALYIALHTNHANELTPKVQNTIKSLHQAGCVLLSQSVLLKNINDNAETLETLFRALTALRVKPYYLHHLDKAPGTSHFRTSIETGQKITRTLRQNLSGIAQPNYILDIPGGYGKIPINAPHLEKTANGSYTVTDIHNQKHDYKD